MAIIAAPFAPASFGSLNLFILLFRASANIWHQMSGYGASAYDVYAFGFSASFSM
jgi:hypothetical protein